MEPQAQLAIIIAAIPFVALGGLLGLSRRIERRRSERIARQVMLTDAIHRELGAATAPVVRQAWPGRWIVSMAVPLDREITVGTVVRIAHEVFAKLDRGETPRLRIVLIPREQGPVRPAGRSRGPGRAPWADARAA